MSNKINKDSTLYKNYLQVLKDRIFKILPLFEEKNEGLFHYINSLTFELNGLQYVIEGLHHSSYYISLLSSIESLLDESIEKVQDLKFIRSEVFRLIGIIEKLQKETKA